MITAVPSRVTSPRLQITAMSAKPAWFEIGREGRITPDPGQGWRNRCRRAVGRLATETFLWAKIPMLACDQHLDGNGKQSVKQLVLFEIEQLLHPASPAVFRTDRPKPKDAGFTQAFAELLINEGLVDAAAISR